MPKAQLNEGKIHYVGIREELFNKVQTVATRENLYVTQFVTRELIALTKDEVNPNPHAGKRAPTQVELDAQSALNEDF